MYNTEFNIVIHAVFIKKIKIGRRLKYGIGIDERSSYKCECGKIGLEKSRPFLFP